MCNGSCQEGRANRLHWIRDITHDEDRSQIRTGHTQAFVVAGRVVHVGAGTSTRVVAFGMGAEGGSMGARHSTRPTESEL